MTPEQYKEVKKALIEKHNLEFKELAEKYAIENNPYKIGDIITDRISNYSIRITSMKVVNIHYAEQPEMFYSGIEVKKDGSDKKSQQNTFIYQHRVK